MSSLSMLLSSPIKVQWNGMFSSLQADRTSCKTPFFSDVLDTAVFNRWFESLFLEAAFRETKKIACIITYYE